MANEQTRMTHSFDPNAGTGDEPKTTPQRPDYVEEQFWDAEKGSINVYDLAKSYKELRTAFSQRSPQKPAEGTTTGTQIPADDPVKTTTEAAGLNWEQIQQKVTATGTLEDADFVAFEKIGVPRHVVEGQIQLAKQLAEANDQLAVAHVGGRENMDALLRWAATNLSQEQKVEYNKKLSSPRWREALDDLRDIRAARSKTAGEPNLQGSGRPGGAQPVGYESKEEMMRDMQDPRYWSDPQFRQAVADKVAASRR